MHRVSLKYTFVSLYVAACTSLKLSYRILSLLQEPPRFYPPICAEDRKPVKVLGLFDGIGTGIIIIIIIIIIVLLPRSN